MKTKETKDGSVVHDTALALAEAGAFNGKSLDFAMREVLGKDWRSASAKERAEVRAVFFTARKSSVDSVASCAAESDRVSVRVGARITGNGGFTTSAVVRAAGLPIGSPEYRRAEEIATAWRNAADAIAAAEFSPDAIREEMGKVGWTAAEVDAVAKLIAVWHASRVPLQWLENNRVTVSRLKAEIRALKP